MVWSTRMLEKEKTTIDWNLLMATECNWQVSKWVLWDLFSRNKFTIKCETASFSGFTVSSEASPGLKNSFLWFERLSESFDAVLGNLVPSSAVYRGLGKSGLLYFMHIVQRNQQIAYILFLPISWCTEKPQPYKAKFSGNSKFWLWYMVLHYFFSPQRIQHYCFIWI